MSRTCGDDCMVCDSHVPGVQGVLGASLEASLAYDPDKIEFELISEVYKLTNQCKQAEENFKHLESMIVTLAKRVNELEKTFEAIQELNIKMTELRRLKGNG